ncbi:MAG: IS1380 family transposase, partial [Burkholderiales bacterium]
MDDRTTQTVLFPELFAKVVVAKFDQAHSSADGGALLLKAADERLRLSERLAAAIVDRRQPGKRRHEMTELLRQRLFGIACGYADANDASRLAQDPIHKLLVERDPIAGAALASQPTLSRFENAPRRADLYRMAEALADTVIGHQRTRRRGRVQRITLDLDPTDDPTHGQQEFAFYNGHYGSWCYLPLVVKLSFDQDREQHVVAVVLRPGNAPGALGAVAVLRRLFAKLRAAFSRARLRVRLDGGFAAPEVLDFLDAEQVEYLVAMAKNARLSPRGRRLLGRARRRARQTGQT